MYNVGDRVKIKNNFDKLRFEYDDVGGRDPGIDNDMLEYAGTEQVICTCIQRKPTPFYEMEDAGLWAWDERWLEPIKEITIEEDSVLGVFT